MQQSLEVLADAALAFANELRARHGHDAADALQPGVPHSCAGCAVAATAGAWRPGVEAGWEVGAGGATFLGPRGGVRETVPVPVVVLEFMAAFDAGSYPGLVLELVAA